MDGSQSGCLRRLQTEHHSLQMLCCSPLFFCCKSLILARQTHTHTRARTQDGSYCSRTVTGASAIKVLMCVRGKVAVGGGGCCEQEERMRAGVKQKRPEKKRQDLRSLCLLLACGFGGRRQVEGISVKLMNTHDMLAHTRRSTSAAHTFHSHLCNGLLPPPPSPSVPQLPYLHCD